MKKFKIIVSITGGSARECLAKIAELSKLQLTTAALFLERLEPGDRQLVYAGLKVSGVTRIPLVHLRSDMTREEIKNLAHDYRVKYFTIHEDYFKVIKHWRGFYRQLYLEMSTDDYVAPNVRVEKIGGFCVDLAHYQKQLTLANRDYRYVYERRQHHKLFACNHVSGYDQQINMDLHLVKSTRDFAYLKALPPFLFGRLLAMEVDNSIKEQLRYIAYIESLFV
jgi:hypothetical protein